VAVNPYNKSRPAPRQPATFFLIPLGRSMSNCPANNFTKIIHFLGRRSVIILMRLNEVVRAA
jgi:hypothetical protein